MKPRNINNLLAIWCIIFSICEYGYVGSLRIGIRRNYSRSHNPHQHGEGEVDFRTNGHLSDLGKHENILSNNISYNSKNEASFLNQKKQLEDDDDDDLGALYNDDDDDDDASTTTGGGSTTSDDDDLELPDQDEGADEEDAQNQLTTEDDAESSGTDEGLKKKFQLSKHEKLIEDKKEQTENTFKKYRFKDDDKDEEVDKEADDDGEGDKTQSNTRDAMKKDLNVFPGLYFAGIGYDSLFGNPLGEADSLTDPGYRGQIILMNWELSNRGIANDLATLQPLNGWIRKENACSRAESIKECSSVSDYAKNLTAEASVSGSYMGFGAFSASTGYKKFLQETSKRTSKTYFIKSNCVKYTVGLPPYVHWEQTTAFKNAVDGLPPHFTGLEADSECASDVYEQKKTSDECETVHTWITFFKTYGTHIIMEAQLGGKITKIIRVENSSVNQMKKDGLSVKAQVQAQFGFASVGGSTNVSSDNSSKSNVDNYEMSEQLVVIGGNPIKDVTKEENLYEWSKTVSTNPMPINIKLLPISTVFETDDLKNSYEKALIYYTRLYGFSPHDTMQKDEKDIVKILTASTTVTNIGAPPISAECPHNMVVLFGFVIRQNFWDHTNKLRSYEMEICESGMSTCTSKQGNTNKYDVSYAYIECGPQALPFIEQVVSVSGTTYNSLKCPNDYSVLFGFGMATSSGKHQSALYTYFTPCRPGMKSCSLNMNNQDDKSYIYLVCVDATIWSGLNNLTLITKDDLHTAVNKYKQFNDGELVVTCPSEGTILTGFYGETHTSSPYVKAPFGKCAKSLKACSVHGCGQAIGMHNYRTLFAVALCKND
ncbi:Sporozoite protein with MAC/Perforin domain [Plasmodium coatneyi]|uniref:Sporozoite protein with MAC/Perforin domain n=1 Tax=Plasmodium coatneyi TaxID=208452 RepID=A0A1B1DTZ7_9APIC|nr:Sporozoite protein with MAC/Perforin domain [Plasmodium coatneyi]ANQ06258.1 Sporozoite protein with MAC/Perforin domain [Plasmodium coatneyi]